MRLHYLESGHRLPQRVFLRVMRLMSGFEPPDVVKTMAYRPRAFGGAFAVLAHELLRGRSGWSVGELELFGAFTSNLNQCRF